jgi:outer membrane biogenesis lipoprotein LolB
MTDLTATMSMKNPLLLAAAVLLTSCGWDMSREAWHRAEQLCAPHGGSVRFADWFEADKSVHALCEDGTNVSAKVKP